MIETAGFSLKICSKRNIFTVLVTELDLDFSRFFSILNYLKCLQGTKNALLGGGGEGQGLEGRLVHCNTGVFR